MKLIIIDHEPYAPNKNNSYCINNFVADGTEVEYWEVNQALPYSKHLTYKNSVDSSIVRRFTTISSILREIKKQNAAHTVFIVEVWYRYATAPLFKLLSKKYKWVKIDYYINPIKVLAAPPLQKNLFSRFKSEIKNLGIRTVAKKLAGRVHLLIDSHRYNTPDILFLTGQQLESQIKARTIIGLDYFDVLQYEELKRTAKQQGNYIVFLDIMLCDHPDIARLGYDNTVIKEEYFRLLNKYFTRLEAQWKMPVVIAAHPKAAYTNEFENRKILSDRSAELVSNATFVLTHGSLSVSYALLAHKKIFYLTAGTLFQKNEFLKDLDRRMDIGCKVFDTIKIDMEEEPPVNMNLEIDSTTYDNHVNRYFRKHDRYLSNYEVLNNAFSNLINGGQ